MMTGEADRVTTADRLCKDCRFYRVPWLDRVSLLGSRYAKCMNPGVTVGHDYLISGKQRSSATFCSVARSYDHLCGVKGRYWQAR